MPIWGTDGTVTGPVQPVPYIPFYTVRFAALSPIAGMVLCSSVSHASEIDRNSSWSSHDKGARYRCMVAAGTDRELVPLTHCLVSRSSKVRSGVRKLLNIFCTISIRQTIFRVIKKVYFHGSPIMAEFKMSLVCLLFSTSDVTCCARSLFQRFNCLLRLSPFRYCTFRKGVCR
jgi:hypothetical protein